jgi:tRNA (guanosine-2'-O-)-methyltransferase
MQITDVSHESLSPILNSPIGRSLRLEDGTVVAPQTALELLLNHITHERWKRIQTVVNNRTLKLVPVLEDIYDRGNTSAVMRSAEAFGCQWFHVIELQEKFKVANRVSQGADKWLTVDRWGSTRQCLQALKKQGYQVLCTTLDARAKPLSDYEFATPTALVFGNEKCGVSDEAVQNSDGSVFVPMEGFVQSFNISVAAALSFYHIVNWRKNHLGYHGDLSAEDRLALQAEYCWKTLDSAESLVRLGLS